MNKHRKAMPEQAAEGYSPLVKPAILRIAEEINMEIQDEIFVQQVSEFCSLVDRPEMKLVGIALPITYESRGYGGFYGFEHANCIMNDYFFTKKLIAEGDMALLSGIIGGQLRSRDIVTVRTEVGGDGNYKVIVGYEIGSFEALPDALPEYAETVTVPACRYAKVLINETKQADRIGYGERMHADEYFIGSFREDTGYVYNPAGYGFNTYDALGDILTKYEPVKLPSSDSERYGSLRFKPVVLPEMKIACSMTPPDSEEFVISKYFGVQDQVFATEAAKYYLHDYYGFPTNSDQEGKINSCFGTRVSSFEGIPDCVEKLTLPGGIYLHITQLEVNGDNPSLPYDAAFNHLEELFLSSHPEYQRDWSRHVIARFRQANCASVFVPLMK
ncbi:GyrI-like domain-containing protein [Paenibacillus sp. HW567]|uniref:GyrI-like domain-containing protein n=1 Tax=Paenibacillus sp. HW567 TaxID=1034769 RepID=UPI00035C436E|nr:GyrI-like domain-containing protein [Paenibacillus sp. HW567]